MRVLNITKDIKKLPKNNKMTTEQAAKHAKKSEQVNGRYTHMPHLKDSPDGKMTGKTTLKNHHDIHDWCHEHDCPGPKSPKRVKVRK